MTEQKTGHAQAVGGTDTAERDASIVPGPDPSAVRRASIFERHVALVHTSGLAALLVFLVAAIFVIPVFLGDRGPHHNELVVVSIMVAGIIAVAERRKIAIALVVLTLAFIAMRLSGVTTAVTSPDLP